MIVCVCNRISSRTIEAYSREGLGLDALRADYGLANNCGQCLEHALEMMQRTREDQSLYTQSALIDTVKIAVI